MKGLGRVQIVVVVATAAATGSTRVCCHARTESRGMTRFMSPALDGLQFVPHIGAHSFGGTATCRPAA